MRGRWRIGRWLVGALVLIFLIGGAGLALAPSLVRAGLMQMADRAGVPVRALEVRGLDWRNVTLDGVALGAADGPTVAEIHATWTWDDLWARRVGRLVVVKPRLAVYLRESGMGVVGLPRLAGANDAAEWPFRRLEVADAAIEAATPLGDLEAAFDAEISASAEGLRLERAAVSTAELAFAQGRLSVADVRYAQGQPLDTVVDVRGVALGELLRLLSVEGLSGSGTLDGRVPLRYDSGRVRIVAGRLDARGPGVVRYGGDALPDPAGGDKSVSERINLVRQALANFHYTSLTLGLDRDATGEGTLTAKLEGANPALMDGHPFNINLRFETNFDRLAAIVTQGYAAAGRLLRPEVAR